MYIYLMEALVTPFIFLGPTVSGKIQKARSYIEQAYNCKLTLPLVERKFTISGDYEARVLASPYHFEIDVPNLSMQDKQIIGELLTTFFMSGDVLNALRTNTRKLVILRRAHSLSLPAAIRVRAILHQFVLPPDATGMLWFTAREMSGSLAVLSDACVIQSVPRMPYNNWLTSDIDDRCKNEEAYERCCGRIERAQEIAEFFSSETSIVWPRRVYDFYDETIKILINAATQGKANITVLKWIRNRIYQALSLCQSPPDIIDSFASGIQNNVDLLEPNVFWLAMKSLSNAEPHTSYRTPLSLENALLQLYEVIRNHTKKSPPTDNGITNETVQTGNEFSEKQSIKPKAVNNRRSSPIKKSIKKG
jgi:hypothetical protein